MAYDSTKPLNDGYLADAPAELREQFRAIVSDQIVDSLKLKGYSPGNASGNIPLSNGTVCTNLNAEKLGGNLASAFATSAHTHAVATTGANGLMSNTDKTKLDSVASGAEVNQNSFGAILVGSTTIQADAEIDTLTLTAGTGITLTPDATNDAVTIAVTSNGHTHTDATTSASGFMSAGSLTKLNGIATGAEVNQNSFSTIVAGGVSVVADAKSDTFTINSGSGITITGDATNDACTIALTSNGHVHADATTSASGFMSASSLTKLNGIATGAEVNQPAFSNIKVGTTTIASDVDADTLEFVAGSNITLTPDATNDRITIAVSGTVPTATSAGTCTGNSATATTATACSGNSATATTLQTPRTINGVSFNGSANITVADSTKLPLAGGTMTGALTLSGDPTSELHAATKRWVESRAGKDSIRCATTATLPMGTYSGTAFSGYATSVAISGTTTSGSASVTVSGAYLKVKVGATVTGTGIPASTTVTVVNGNAITLSANATASGTVTLTFTQTISALVIDGITLALNDRVLVKNQNDTGYNGIYYLSTLGTTSVPWVLTRTPDADTWADISGALCIIEDGTVNGNSIWVCTNNTSQAGAFPSTAVTFQKVSDTSIGNVSVTPTPNSCVARDASGDISGRLFRSEYTSTSTSTTPYVMVQQALGTTASSADNYIRPMTLAQLKSNLGVPTLIPHDYQIFTANGTFTVPASVTKIKVTCVGGAGGGGGGDTSANWGGGAGQPGATGWVNSYIFSVTPGTSYTVTVGTGGTGGPMFGGDTTTGSTGGTSSFGVLLSAPGGVGGNHDYAGYSYTGRYGIYYGYSIGGAGGGIGSIGGTGGNGFVLVEW